MENNNGVVDSNFGNDKNCFLKLSRLGSLVFRKVRTMKILFKVIKALAVLTTSAFFLVGCGGGGGASQGSGDGQSSGGGGNIPSTPTTQEQFSGLSSDSVLYGNARDSRGNIYATGYTKKANLDGNTNAGGSDIVLSKYDSSFNKQWRKLFGTSANDVGASLAIDSGDDVYVVGGTLGDLEGNRNAGGIDVFLMKFDASGNKLRTILVGTSMNEYATGVALDSNGNVYVSGITYGNLDGNTNVGQSDVFLMKFDASGNKLWTCLFGTIENDYGNTITVDTSDHIYVLGATHGSLDGRKNAGGIDLFVMKFNSAGIKEGDFFRGTSLNDIGTGILADISGTVNTIYMVGYIYDSLNGTPNMEFRYFSDEIWS